MPDPFSTDVEWACPPRTPRASRCRPLFAGAALALLTGGAAGGAAGPAHAADLAYVIPAPYRGTSLVVPERPDPVQLGSPRSPGPLATLLRWEVRREDLTLARTLARWAATAGYVVRWEAPSTIPIDAADSYDGTFEGAIETALNSAGIADGDDPLEACVYPNSPPLVRITRRGKQARECPDP